MAYSPNPSQTQDAAYVPGSVSIIGGVRQDSDASPISADGDVHPFVFNSIGRLKASIQPAATSATTGNITANGQTVSCDVQRQSIITMYCTGTFSTVNVTFEASIDGGTTWFGIQVGRTNANTIETVTGNLSAAPAYAWRASVNGYTHVRIRATAFTSGTQVWTFLPGAMSSEPVPMINTHAVSQSGTWNIGTVTTLTGTTALTPGTAAANLGKAEDAAHASGDTGVAAWGVRNDGAATTFASATGDYSPLAVDAQGRTLIVNKAPTATATNVASSATNVTILAANTGRLGATVFNDSTQSLSLKLGATASATSFTVKIASQGYYEVPFGYTGIIDGIWASADGSARVTELT